MILLKETLPCQGKSSIFHLTSDKNISHIVSISAQGVLLTLVLSYISHNIHSASLIFFFILMQVELACLTNLWFDIFLFVLYQSVYFVHHQLTHGGSGTNPQWLLWEEFLYDTHCSQCEIMNMNSIEMKTNQGTSLPITDKLLYIINVD